MNKELMTRQEAKIATKQVKKVQKLCDQLLEKTSKMPPGVLKITMVSFVKIALLVTKLIVEKQNKPA